MKVTIDGIIIFYFRFESISGYWVNGWDASWVYEIVLLADRKLMRAQVLSPGGALSKNTHQAQWDNHVLGVNLELSALQNDI